MIENEIRDILKQYLPVTPEGDYLHIDEITKDMMQLFYKLPAEPFTNELVTALLVNALRLLTLQQRIDLTISLLERTPEAIKKWVPMVMDKWLQADPKKQEGES